MLDPNRRHANNITLDTSCCQRYMRSGVRPISREGLSLLAGERVVTVGSSDASASLEPSRSESLAGINQLRAEVTRLHNSSGSAAGPVTSTAKHGLRPVRVVSGGSGRLVDQAPQSRRLPAVDRRGDRLTPARRCHKRDLSAAARRHLHAVGMRFRRRVLGPRRARLHGPVPRCRRSRRVGTITIRRRGTRVGVLHPTCASHSGPGDGQPRSSDTKSPSSTRPSSPAFGRPSTTPPPT